MITEENTHLLRTDGYDNFIAMRGTAEHYAIQQWQNYAEILGSNLEPRAFFWRRALCGSGEWIFLKCPQAFDLYALFNFAGWLDDKKRTGAPDLLFVVARHRRSPQYSYIAQRDARNPRGDTMIGQFQNGAYFTLSLPDAYNDEITFIAPAEDRMPQKDALPWEELLSKDYLPLGGLSRKKVPHWPQRPSFSPCFYAPPDGEKAAAPAYETDQCLRLTGLEIVSFRQLHCEETLTELTVDGLGIAGYEALGRFTQLRSLVIRNAGLRDLSFLTPLRNLTDLSLWNNEIEDLSPLQNLQQLSHLDLINNPVRDFSVLRTLPRLRVLCADPRQLPDEAACRALQLPGTVIHVIRRWRDDTGENARNGYAGKTVLSYTPEKDG